MPEEDRVNIGESELHARLLFLLGGRAAEKLVFNEFSAGAEDDLNKATQIARRMVTHWGMSERLGPVAFRDTEEHPFLGKEMAAPRQFSEHTAQVIDEEVIRILRDGPQRADDMLTANREKLDLLAHAGKGRDARRKHGRGVLGPAAKMKDARRTRRIARSTCCSLIGRQNQLSGGTGVSPVQIAADISRASAEHWRDASATRREASLDLTSRAVAIPGGDLADPPGVAAALEGSVEPDLHEPIHEPVAQHVAGKAKDVQIVVAAAEFRGDVVVARGGANAGNLVGGNAHPQPGAADQNAAFGLLGGHFAADDGGDVRVVDVSSPWLPTSITSWPSLPSNSTSFARMSTPRWSLPTAIRIAAAPLRVFPITPANRLILPANVGQYNYAADFSKGSLWRGISRAVLLPLPQRLGHRHGGRSGEKQGRPGRKDGTEEFDRPECWQPITTIEKTKTTPMPRPMARNTLRLLREATNGSPIKNSVMSKKGFTIRAWMATRRGAEVDAAVAEAGDQLGGRSKSAERIPAVGAKGLERNAADHETLVRPEPGGVARGNQDLLPLELQRRLPGQILRFLNAVQQVSGRVIARGARKKAFSAVNCSP